MGKPIEDMAVRVVAGRVRTAGRIEFIRDQGPLRRDVRSREFAWEPDTLRNLAKILWAAERAHSYGMSALRLFSKMNSSDFSPDGLLGGFGYIQKVPDMRAGLSQSVEVLSGFLDTVHDEINAPHWANAGEDPVAEEIVEDAALVKADPEGFVEQQFQQQVPEAQGEFEGYENPNPEDYNPFLEAKEAKDEDDWGWDWEELSTPALASGGTLSSTTDITEDTEIPLPGPKSELPSDDSLQEEGVTPVEMLMNTTGEHPRGNYAGAIERVLERFRAHNASMGGPVLRTADSSVAPETLPGPRVMHVGPGESPEEFGYFTDQGELPSDDPLGEGFSQLERIEESPVADGVTGYTDATQGDETVFKMSAIRVADSYSWLPGTTNEKNLNYYELGLTAEEVDWMRANNEPDMPPGIEPEPIRPPTDSLWDSVRG